MSVGLQSAYLRACGHIQMSLIQLLIEGVHGSDQISRKMDLKRASLDKGCHRHSQEISSYVKMVMKKNLGPFSARHLVVPEASFVPSRLMMNNIIETHQVTLATIETLGVRNQYGEDSSPDHESPMLYMRSDGVALGLVSSGRLNVDDVKNAYRACALKWHPDRHQGSSKVNDVLLAGSNTLVSCSSDATVRTCVMTGRTFGRK
ncbi:Chaperone DnaJ-domain superfamily protein, partial [Striga hermonthica]